MATLLEATEENVRRAADVIRAGGVVAFPTETVYGLGGATFSVDAVERIHRLKGRPADNPLIAHVLDVRGAARVAAEWSRECDALAAAFWPGPLTVVVPKAPAVPRQATGGRDTVAVRSPSHPVARTLLGMLDGEPVSAPSANMSGRTSATSAAHVMSDFAGEAGLLVLDGGACQVGIESTVLDMTAAVPVVLRPGSVTADAIGAVLGRAVSTRESRVQGASPGTLAHHYAPVTPATLVPRDQLLAALEAERARCAVLTVWPHMIPQHLRERHAIIPMPEICEAYAAILYDRLRIADALVCARIIVQDPCAAADARWAAVHDRLLRATASES